MAHHHRQDQDLLGPCEGIWNKANEELHAQCLQYTNQQVASNLSFYQIPHHHCQQKETLRNTMRNP